MSFEPFFVVTISGAKFTHDFPKILAMIHVEQMSGFMRTDITRDLRREKNEAPI